MHIISYENDALQQKFFVHELERFFLVRNLPLSPTQYTNTRPFSTVLTGQLHEVL
jgi:hypothetical protein